MYLGVSRTCPVCVFDSDMEAHVNRRRGVTDGLDRELVVKNPAGPKSSRNVPASWRIHKKSRSFRSSIGKSWELIAHV